MSYFDNRTSELGLQWDAERILADLNAGVKLDGMWNQYELDNLLRYVTMPDEFPEYDESIADDVEMCICPNCGHKFPK